MIQNLIHWVGFPGHHSCDPSFFCRPKLFPVYFLWWQFLTVTMINNFDNDHFMSIIWHYLFSVLMGLVLIWANFELGQFLLGQFWFGSVLIEVSFDLGSILIWVSFDWFSFDLVQFRFRPVLIGVSFDLWSILIRASFDLGQFCRHICS